MITEKREPVVLLKSIKFGSDKRYNSLMSKQVDINIFTN